MGWVAVLWVSLAPAQANLSQTSAASPYASPYEVSPNMIVEWLKFRMDPAQRQHYLETDSAIWTPALAEYPGFIDKVTWLDPEHRDQVVFVIRWASREQWKAIAEDELTAITQRFDEAFGESYDMLESKEFYPQL